MRAVRAKALRKLARAETVGAPNAVWLDSGRKVVKKDAKGKPHIVWAPRCELATGCTRSKYQLLKRAYKEQRRG